MDVRVRSGAISTADLFQATNRLVNPNEPDVSVNIRTTRQGSFEVLLKLIYDGAIGVLTSPPMLVTRKEVRRGPKQDGGVLTEGRPRPPSRAPLLSKEARWRSTSGHQRPAQMQKV